MVLCHSASLVPSPEVCRRVNLTELDQVVAATLPHYACALHAMVGGVMDTGLKMDVNVLKQISLLGSRRCRIHQASTERLRKSFYPQATRILNEGTV